jgi:3,4-dihydroxy 2-butanone 4-phosphate synthase / GTP cyclohydrolase II
MLLPLLERFSESTLMTRFGAFTLVGFIGRSRRAPVLALIVGNPSDQVSPLIRVQSKCATSEVFGSLQCDCAEQLEYSMQLIQSAGSGAIIYLDQEARGNGLEAKLKIYQLMQEQYMTSEQACKSLHIPVDNRNYDEAAAVVLALGLRQIRLLTNNPCKVRALQSSGIEVEELNVPVTPNTYNFKYLQEKYERFGHQLGLFADLQK